MQTFTFQLLRPCVFCQAAPRIRAEGSSCWQKLLTQPKRDSIWSMALPSSGYHLSCYRTPQVGRPIVPNQSPNVKVVAFTPVSRPRYTQYWSFPLKKKKRKKHFLGLFAFRSFVRTGRHTSESFPADDQLSLCSTLQPYTQSPVCNDFPGWRMSLCIVVAVHV